MRVCDWNDVVNIDLYRYRVIYVCTCSVHRLRDDDARVVDRRVSVKDDDDVDDEVGNDGRMMMMKIYVWTLQHVM